MISLCSTLHPANFKDYEKAQHIFFITKLFFFFGCITSRAQVNLPYPLTFSSDDPIHWTDGVTKFLVLNKMFGKAAAKQ